MILASDYLDTAVQVATVVAPVALYFLILGLLNSRRHPQLLTGRRDFALLIIALTPLFALPALYYAGVSFPVVALSAMVVAGGVALLAPRGRSWVIYNMSIGEARRTLTDALGALGLPVRTEGAGLKIEGSDARVVVGGFPLLRNVSVRLVGGDEKLARRIERELARRLAAVSAETSPTAVALLLVATAMLIGPLTLVADRVPEMVRIITDLL